MGLPEKNNPTELYNIKPRDHVRIAAILLSTETLKPDRYIFKLPE